VPEVLRWKWPCIECQQENSGRQEAQVRTTAQYLDDFGPQAVVVKTYAGLREEITARFRRDMLVMADKDYRIESQQLIPGKRVSGTASCRSCHALKPR
jgi:hydroxymethylpyrimidine/phosphomethylpyrimidine kinase